MNNWICFITVIIYLTILISLYYAFKMENEDLNNFKNRFDENDGPIENIIKASKYDIYSIKWRRCLIFSIITGLIIFFVITGRPPNGQELIFPVLIIYILIYLTYDFYTNNLSIVSHNIIKNNVNYI